MSKCAGCGKPLGLNEKICQGCGIRTPESNLGGEIHPSLKFVPPNPVNIPKAPVFHKKVEERKAVVIERLPPVKDNGLSFGKILALFVALAAVLAIAYFWFWLPKQTQDQATLEDVKKVAEVQAPANQDSNAAKAAAAAYSQGDYTTALKIMRVLVAQGNAVTQYNLGYMYQNGQGVTRDYKEAARLYSLAAEQGLADAQGNLGLMYEKGWGVPIDYKEAVRLYKLAAGQGNVTTQYNLGLIYDKGQVVAQDYTEAVKWYRLAAEQGDVKAQYNLGGMYSDGQGVAQDYTYAYMWWSLASSAGNADAVKGIAYASSKMTNQQIERAQGMAKSCQTSNFKGC